MKLRCSLCGKPYEFHYIPGEHVGSFPFCSERCKMIDLGKWLDEEYCLSTPLPELNGLDENERQLLVQYLLDSGLADMVKDDDSESDATDSD